MKFYRLKAALLHKYLQVFHKTVRYASENSRDIFSVVVEPFMNYCCRTYFNVLKPLSLH